MINLGAPTKWKPSLIIAVSIWFAAQLAYISIAAFMAFQQKSDMFSAKADEIVTCLERRIAQNFAFVKTFETFSTLSGAESVKVFGSLVQHTMEGYPRIRLVNLYEQTHDDNPAAATLTASFPPNKDDAAIRAVMPNILKQPHNTIRGFADSNFPGQYFTTAHTKNGYLHYVIVMLVDVEEMIKPFLSNASPKIEWVIGGLPTMAQNDQPESILGRFLTLEKTIVTGTGTLSPQDFTWFPEGTVFRINETLKLDDLFNLLNLIVYCCLSTAAITAAYHALHQRQISQRSQRSEEEALGRAARLEKENRLEHASRVNAVGELAAGIIHELAQPLTALLSQSQASLKVLEQDQPPTEFLQRAMTANVRDANRAGRILGKIRDYIVQTGAAPETTDLNSAILDIVEILNVELKRQSVSLTLRLANPSPTANINKTELEQVVHNLVRNAMEALGTSEQMDKRITIETRVDLNGSIIRVSDNGSGLSGETLSQLFQPFFTTKSSGMGLGLSLSQRIIQRSNGVLTASSNNGAVFTIKLPNTSTGLATEENLSQDPSLRLNLRPLKVA